MINSLLEEAISISSHATSSSIWHLFARKCVIQKVSKFELFENHMRGNKLPNLMRKIVFYSLVINVKEFTGSKIRSLNNPTVQFAQYNTD